MLQLNNTFIPQFEKAIVELELKTQLMRARLIRCTELKNRINTLGIDSMLSKLGLTIVSELFRFSSSDEDTIATIEQRDGVLELRVKVESWSKIKPVKDEGYTKSGGGRNHDKLVKRAKDIEEKIYTLTDHKCSINYYGLEINDRNVGKDFTFSIELFIS